MKKSISTLFLFLALSFVFITNIKAETTRAIINEHSVNLRTGPGTNYPSLKLLGINASFELADINKSKDERGCPDDWYKIYYSGKEIGYVCSTYVTLEVVKDPDPEAITACEKELDVKGFPKSYWKSLCNLKAKYPKWNFEIDKTNLDFTTSVQKQAVGKKALIQSTNQGYFSTDSSSYDYLLDKFVVKEGSNWYSANAGVVAYYLDPRNFLDERFIFQFETLSYDEKYQTEDAVKMVFSNRDISEKASVVVSAGKANNINAIYLASKIKQETGGNYSNYSLKGNPVTLNGIYYEHVYNPYNIGAYTGAEDGLIWAVNGTSHQRPWITLEKSILGGASVITSDYISQGQDTIYFQKFNTSSYSNYSAYSHQYMTNVRGASSEASISYDGYNNMNLLKVAFTFRIPVYNNMPDVASVLPNDGNPNNHLKSLSINNTKITGFSHDKYEYNHYVAKGTNNVDILGKTINDKASVIGNGTVNLTKDKTTIKVKVTAENKSVQEYIINVIKTDGIDMKVGDIIVNSKVPISDNVMLLSAGYSVSAITSLLQKTSATAEVSIAGKNAGNLVTGDTITIVNGDDSKTYNISIKGDPTGDGNINIQDLLRIQKYILGYNILTGSYYKAGDVNQDGKVDIADLLRTQKHILGYAVIK